jgi:hypothetical protein
MMTDPRTPFIKRDEWERAALAEGFAVRERPGGEATAEDVEGDLTGHWREDTGLLCRDAQEYGRWWQEQEDAYWEDQRARMEAALEP